MHKSGLKATRIIGQRKAFYRHRIPEFSCARKETVDIDILVTSRNGDRKIMQSIRIKSRPQLISIIELNVTSKLDLETFINKCYINKKYAAKTCSVMLVLPWSTFQ